MPDVSWNNQMWNADHDWPQEGEEWSEPWGGAEPQWFGMIYPRLHRFLPVGRVLEIATGYGRWTRYLVPQCSRYLGIDLSANAIEHCRRRFSQFPHADFVANDGLSLDAAPEGVFDLVFSFDSLVHVEIDVIESYVSQTLEKLKANGVALFHHSNALVYEDIFPDPAPGFRARSVSGDLFKATVERHGGRVLVQERINWGGGPYLADCITLFARNEHVSKIPAQILENDQFFEEAELIKANQSPYSKIDR